MSAFLYHDSFSFRDSGFLLIPWSVCSFSRLFFMNLVQNSSGNWKLILERNVNYHLYKLAYGQVHGLNKNAINQTYFFITDGDDKTGLFNESDTLTFMFACWRRFTRGSPALSLLTVSVKRENIFMGIEWSLRAWEHSVFPCEHEHWQKVALPSTF